MIFFNKSTFFSFWDDNVINSDKYKTCHY